MIENKLTDEQVIKALECCTTDKGEDCESCPYNGMYYEQGFGGCCNKLSRDALGLLNRLNAEKEALINGQKTLQKHIAELKAEIERLTNKCDDCAGCSEWKCDCSNIRKEFAERLKNKFDNLEYRDENPDMKHKGECILHEAVPKVVDMVLKEMEGN